MQQSTVSRSALIQRISRKLKPSYEQLRVTRGQSGRLDLGDFYVLDAYNNIVVRSRVDPVQLGRALKVLAEWETAEV